ncbi:MAG: UDP-N-acetylglucosamine/UDP-N-acetylgalactosamine diphosphorylase [Pseudohongiellaceae bacterium]|jgi:UDP-N-acetylglucosamine/UDP-N-acetylgalactosamine diphosphorylase
MSDRRIVIAQALAKVGQEHVLRFADELAADELSSLLDQVEALDLVRLARLIQEVLSSKTEALGASPLQPPVLIEQGSDSAILARDQAAREAGEALLRAGKVGAFLVAGGQGTRLGYDGPKGRYPVGPLTHRSLFAYHAHRVLASSRRYDAALPYYVMTSTANHDNTVSAFEEAGWFGLDPDQVVFFSQGLLPAIDAAGKMLLASRSSLALSPDGHGGCFDAMERNGALDDMERRGLEQLFYFQVDNPLAQVFDPLFIGHHALASADMSTKVVEKSSADEKVGVLATQDGKHCLVEYSDLSDELATATDDNGRLRFRAGNIAIHMLKLSFIRRLLSEGAGLPVHRANKKVPCLDGHGQLVDPQEPNAIKMEMFVFDALGFADGVTTQDVHRGDEFAPVKNAEGADSPDTARAALSAQAKRWATSADLPVGSGDLEVGPLFALDPDEFKNTLTKADVGPVFDRS